MQGFGEEIRRKDMNLEDAGVDTRTIKMYLEKNRIKGRGLDLPGSEEEHAVNRVIRFGFHSMRGIS
jgi:hypothetical protein